MPGVSKRKFDRHVPRIRPESQSSDEDDSQTEEEKRALISGEEVYLLHNGKEVFKAKFESTDLPDSTVHGK